MKIAILYICTGRYNQFFWGFYQSIIKNFLPSYQKTFFVWSDDESICKGFKDVVFYYKKCAGFPADSLFRFEMFLQAEEQIKIYDYVYFFNSNAEVVLPVGNDILPDETGLAMGIWPDANMSRHPMFFPYERNKKSLAYIKPWGKNYKYYMGGINGGTSKDYLAMVRTLATNIRKDYEAGIVAYVHDESHINRYLRDHKCKVLGPLYTTPEEFTYGVLDYKPCIIFRDKVKIDPYFKKGRKLGFISKVKKSIQLLFRAILWYF